MKTLREFVEYLAKVKNENNGENLPIFAYDGRMQIAKATLTYKTTYSDKDPNGDIIPVGSSNNTNLYITPQILGQYRNSLGSPRVFVEDGLKVEPTLDGWLGFLSSLSPEELEEPLAFLNTGMSLVMATNISIGRSEIYVFQDARDSRQITWQSKKDAPNITDEARKRFKIFEPGKSLVIIYRIGDAVMCNGEFLNSRVKKMSGYIDLNDFTLQ